MDGDILAFLLGVLEDYSNRYVCFGALFVACIFGMYAILGIEDIKRHKLFSKILFIILFFSGTISLFLTYEYSQLTSAITNYIINSNDKYILEWIKLFPNYYLFKSFNALIYKYYKLIFWFIFVIYFCITFIPFDLCLHWGLTSRFKKWLRKDC